MLLGKQETSRSFFRWYFCSRFILSLFSTYVEVMYFASSLVSHVIARHTYLTDIALLFTPIPSLGG